MRLVVELAGHRYGHVKERHVKAAQDKQANLLARFGMVQGSDKAA